MADGSEKLLPISHLFAISFFQIFTTLYRISTKRKRKGELEWLSEHIPATH